MIHPEVLRNARIIWDFLKMGHQLRKADCIFTMGSNDLRVAERSAQLYLEGYAELLVFSGGLGRFTANNWKESEAEKFARVATSSGVPEDKILKEDKSTNSGENVRFTRLLLEERGIDANSFILVQKPFMEKRAFATFLQHWPGKQAIVTSPLISFETYPNEGTSLELLIHTLVGEFQRMLVYPPKSFQVEMPVTQEALAAYRFLESAGFRNQMV